MSCSRSPWVLKVPFRPPLRPPPPPPLLLRALLSVTGRGMVSIARPAFTPRLICSHRRASPCSWTSINPTAAAADLPPLAAAAAAAAAAAEVAAAAAAAALRQSAAAAAAEPRRPVQSWAPLCVCRRRPSAPLSAQRSVASSTSHAHRRARKWSRRKAQSLYAVTTGWAAPRLKRLVASTRRFGRHRRACAPSPRSSPTSSAPTVPLPSTPRMLRRASKRSVGSHAPCRLPVPLARAACPCCWCPCRLAVLLAHAGCLWP